MATKKAAKKAPAKKAAAKKTAAEGSTGRGRTSQFAGMVLTKVAEMNPRREGTHGHASFALIKNGMTYEKYVEAGGRLVDLVWDVEKGNVKVSKAK